MTTQLFPIAVAGIFFLAGAAEPICSICFLGFAYSNTRKDAVESYLAHKTLHKLAIIAPSVDEAKMRIFVEESAKDVNEAFGVDCNGFLNDYTLSITPAEGGGAA